MNPSLWLVETLVTGIAMAVIGTGLLQNLTQLVQLGLAALALMRRPAAGRFGALWQRYSDSAPPIAFIVPAFNEERSIANNIQALLAVQYPNVELVVVDDGSTDGTLAALVRTYGLVATARDFDDILPHQPIRAVFASPREPRLIVVAKANGGKADALNCGINVTRAPLVCTIDADSILEPDSLLRAVRPFIDDPEKTVAVGATVRVGNGCRVVDGRVVEVGLSNRPLVLMQTVEYLRAFLMARLAWSEVSALTMVSGAFGLFRRQTIIEVGGYSTDTVGEDFELIVKIHRHLHDRGQPYHIEFIPEPVCWTEVPETLAALGRQRTRWHRGALETFAKHWQMLGRPRYGRIGLIGMSNSLLVDVIGPIVEVLGYLVIPTTWALGWLSWSYFLAFFSISCTFGITISVGALFLEELELRRFPRPRDMALLLMAAILENFGYRQLNNLWRLQGFWQYLRGRRDWGSMTRVGFRSA